MLDLTGILHGGFCRDTEFFKPGGNEQMPFVDHFGDLLAAFREIDKTLFGDGDLIFFFQIFHGDADAGFFKIQFVGDVHGTDHRQFFTQYKNSLQIIFRRFVNKTFHIMIPILILHYRKIPVVYTIYLPLLLYRPALCAGCIVIQYNTVFGR